MLRDFFVQEVGGSLFFPDKTTYMQAIFRQCCECMDARERIFIGCITHHQKWVIRRCGYAQK